MEKKPMTGNGIEESRVAADGEPEVLTPDRQAFRVGRDAPNGSGRAKRTEDDQALGYLFAGPRVWISGEGALEGLWRGSRRDLIRRIGQIQALEGPMDELGGVAELGFEGFQRPGGDAVAGVETAVLVHHHLLVEGGIHLVLLLE